MHQEPARKLLEIVAQHGGPSLCDDVRRCEALLKDLCPRHEREVFLLTCAIGRRIHTDLLSSRNGHPLEVVLARLTRRLSGQLCLTEDAARWAVESVAVAVGSASESEIASLRQARLAEASKPIPKTIPDHSTRRTSTMSRASTATAKSHPAAPPKVPKAPAPIPFTPKPVQPLPRPAQTGVPKVRRRFGGTWALASIGILMLAIAIVAVLIEMKVRFIHQHLNDDEAWGDLGDLYSIARWQENARGCYEIALLLDPTDSEWREKVELFSGASLIRRLEIRDDAWKRSLGVKALRQGLPATGLTFLEQVHGHDSEAPGSSTGPLIAQLNRNPGDPQAWARLGDAVTSSASLREAQSFYAVARLAGPDSDDLAAKAPELAASATALQAVEVTDTAWLASLASTAYKRHALAASRDLYALTESLDTSNPEWTRRRVALEVIEQHRRVLSKQTPREVWVALGEAYEIMGSPRRAAGHYGVAQLIRPNDSTPAATAENVADAILLLKATGIRDDEWIGDRGDVALQLGFQWQALQLYRWALAIQPTDFEWLGKVGQLAPSPSAR